MRTRSRSNQQLYPDSTCRVKVGSWSPLTTRASFSEGYELFQDDVRIGYFKQLKTGGVLPVGPMVSTKIEEFVFGQNANVSGDLKISSSTWLEGHYGIEAVSSLFGVRDRDALTPPPLPTVNQAALVQKAKANAETNSWDFLTFAAEFQKTVDMFRTAQTRYWDHFMKVFGKVEKLKGARKEMTDVVDVFSSVWLEYRFGLRPVLYDIQAINEMIRRMREGIPALSRGWASDTDETLRVSAQALPLLDVKTVQNGSVIPVGSLSTTGTFTDTTAIWKRTLTGRASVGVTVDWKGLGFADVPLSVWELTPWSVFIDYFLNIGDILAAASPMGNTSLAYATYSTEMVDEVTQTGKFRLVDSETGGAGSIRWKSDDVTSTWIWRQTTKQRILVTPTVDLSFSFDLNIAQVTDLIAVAWGMRRKGLALLKSLASRR